MRCVAIKNIKSKYFRITIFLQEFKGHNDSIYTIDYDKNLKLICSGSLDKTIKIWSNHIETKSCLVGTLESHKDAVRSVIFLKKTSGKLISGSYDTTLKEWVKIK